MCTHTGKPQIVNSISHMRARMDVSRKRLSDWQVHHLPCGASVIVPCACGWTCQERCAVGNPANGLCVLRGAESEGHLTKRTEVTPVVAEAPVVSAVETAKAQVAEARAVLAAAKASEKANKPAKVKAVKPTPEWRAGYETEFATMLAGFIAGGFSPADAKSMANKAIFAYMRTPKPAVVVA